jgi:hypothetical protein
VLKTAYPDTLKVFFGAGIHLPGIHKNHVHMGLCSKSLKPTAGPKGVSAGFGVNVSLKDERDGFHDGGLALGPAKITQFAGPRVI